MKTAHLATAFLAAVILAASPSTGDAGQRPRNPGGDGGSSGGGGGTYGGGASGGTSDGGSGRVAMPRDGGASPWDGGGRGVSSRPSEPSSTPSSGGRRPARVSGGDGNAAGGAVPPYSRSGNGRPVTGYAVPRGTVATLPPIISGPVYWGPDNWYFYPWGFGGLGLGYFWDPMMWSGMWSGMGGYGGGYGYNGYGYGGYGYGGYGYGGNPYDPIYGVGGGGWGAGGGGSDAGSARDGGQSGQFGNVPNPLDPNAPTGGLRLKVEPRDAEVLIDGFLAGRVDDFDGAMQRLKVAEGPHRVELRAPGYETATFDIVIVVGQTTTYRTELKKR